MNEYEQWFRANIGWRLLEKCKKNNISEKIRKRNELVIARYSKHNWLQSINQKELRGWWKDTIGFHGTETERIRYWNGSNQDWFD